MTRLSMGIFLRYNVFFDRRCFTTHNYILSFGTLLMLQPVVDAFDPRLLVAPSISHTIDFTKIKV